MGWHKMRRRTNGSKVAKVLEMAEFCANLGVTRKAANDLANRWFQPLTHVSVGWTPRVSESCCQRGKRETRDEHRFAVAQAAAQSVLTAFRQSKRAGMRRPPQPGPDRMNLSWRSNG
jgi:hypothetical protein